MTGIVCLLQEAKDRELYEAYSAQCLWTIASGLYSLGEQQFNMPQYVEMIHPETMTKQPTAQQIKDHVVGRLLEGL